MVNGIAYSGVVQHVSKLICTISCLKLIALNQDSAFKFQSLFHSIRLFWIFMSPSGPGERGDLVVNASDFRSKADLYTPTHFAYFLCFWAPNYALRITITKLRP